jgi:hypothetical protein
MPPPRDILTEDLRQSLSRGEITREQVSSSTATAFQTLEKQQSIPKAGGFLDHEDLSRLHDAIVSRDAHEHQNSQRPAKSKSPYLPYIWQAAQQRFPDGIPSEYDGPAQLQRYLEPSLRDMKEANLPKTGIAAKTYARALKTYPRKK